MEILDLRKKVINQCKALLQERASNAKSAMDDMQNSANEYGIPRDKYDTFKAQVLRNKDMFAKQYQTALNDLVLLEKINLNKTSDKVEFGSIVITSKQKLIIAISLGKIEIDNEFYFAISPQVPIYKSIKGLKKNDKFIFNGIEQEIVEIL